MKKKKKAQKRRLNTKLESEGAEFLVLGTMLIEGIVCHKTYTNVPGYDLIASNPEKNTSARIQVKSRWATDFDGGFLISKFDCDFVVFACLNRGYRYHKNKKNTKSSDGRRAPDIFVLPVEVAKTSLYKKSSWGKIYLKDIAGGSERYKNNWASVKKFLLEKET